MKLNKKNIEIVSKIGCDCCVIYNVSLELYLQYIESHTDLWKGETDKRQYGHCYDIEYARPINFNTARLIEKRYKKYCSDHGYVYRILPYKRSLSKWNEND